MGDRPSSCSSLRSILVPPNREPQENRDAQPAEVFPTAGSPSTTSYRSRRRVVPKPGAARVSTPRAARDRHEWHSSVVKLLSRTIPRSRRTRETNHHAAKRSCQPFPRWRTDAERRMMGFSMFTSMADPRRFLVPSYDTAKYLYATDTMAG